jgi:hypothetical protein
MGEARSGTYDCGRYRDVSIGIFEARDDNAGERCVEEYGHDDHAMDGTLDEPHHKRPSAIGVSPESGLISLTPTFGA